GAEALGDREMGGDRSIDPDRPRPLLEDRDRVVGRFEERPAAMDLGGVENFVRDAVRAGTLARTGHDGALAWPAIEPAGPGEQPSRRLTLEILPALPGSRGQGHEPRMLEMGDADHSRPAAGRAERLPAAEPLEPEDAPPAAGERGSRRRPMRAEPDDDRVERLHRRDPTPPSWRYGRRVSGRQARGPWPGADRADPRPSRWRAPATPRGCGLRRSGCCRTR